MKGNGNSFGTLAQKLWFYVLPTAGMRTRYIQRHKELFHRVGENIFWQPRNFPADPEHISIGNNVSIASKVTFINHDVVAKMLNRKYETQDFQRLRGCIEICDNVAVGTGVTILPNVRIGSNVVVGAGAVVTKDIPSGSVAAGVPCRVIGSFEDFVKKRRAVEDLSSQELWDAFYNQRK